MVRREQSFEDLTVCSSGLYLAWKYTSTLCSSGTDLEWPEIFMSKASMSAAWCARHPRQFKKSECPVTETPPHFHPRTCLCEELRAVEELHFMNPLAFSACELW